MKALSNAQKRVRLMLALTLVLLFAILVYTKLQQSKPRQAQTNTTMLVPTKDLQGRKLGGLYSLYLNLSETEVGDTLRVNFFQALTKMWDKKVEKSPNNPVVHSMRIVVPEDYGMCTQVSLQEYKRQIDNVCQTLEQSMDWSRVASLYKLSPQEMQYLRKATHKISSDELLAYALTELMPSSHGAINIQVFELLLNHAGREYVELIPALGDDLVSFGLYQMTSHAVFDTPKEKRGASIANQALPSSLKIPGSVSKLRGDDHHKAAWLFAVHNLAMAMKRGCSVEFNKEELVEFIAMAHHNPEQTFLFVQGLAAPNWVKRLSEYAEKTAKNYKAIKGFGDIFAKTLFYMRQKIKAPERFREPSPNCFNYEKCLHIFQVYIYTIFLICQA